MTISRNSSEVRNHEGPENQGRDCRAWKSILDDFAKTGEAVARGEKVKKETGTYFT